MKLSVSNIHIFVPIWIIPDPVRHVRLLASRDIQPKTRGWIEYKEGWFEIRRSKATAESTLCGMQIHYGDQHIDPFPTEEWKLIERFAQGGLLKQEVWSSRLQWLGVKAKIEIPLSGTGFNVRQNTLHIENLPESWPMDTESAWRERFSKVGFSFQDIVEHLQDESFTDDIFEGYENTKAFRWIAVIAGLCHPLGGKHSSSVATQISAPSYTTTARGHPPLCTRQRRISHAIEPLHGLTV